MSTEQTAPNTRRELDQIISGLVDLGSTWARYGLTIGRAALETSSKTLGTTAELLGAVADRLDIARPPAAKEEAPKQDA